MLEIQNHVTDKTFAFCQFIFQSILDEARLLAGMHEYVKKDRKEPPTEQDEEGRRTMAEVMFGASGDKSYKTESLPIEDELETLRSFDETAAKYGVVYNISKAQQSIDAQEPTVVVTFRAKDKDAMDAAFQEHLAKTINAYRREGRPFIFAQPTDSDRQREESSLQPKPERDLLTDFDNFNRSSPKPNAGQSDR